MTPDDIIASDRSAWIVARLEQAGATLIALRVARIGPQEPRSGLPEPVREVSASYGWSKATPRSAAPCGAAIDAMDEALSWVGYIPESRYVLRRIVNARCLVSPTTQRHLYTWSAIGRLIGADRRAVQRWHAQGITLICAGLKKRELTCNHGRVMGHARIMRPELLDAAQALRIAGYSR
jgi:hypothetical protein